MERTQEHVSTKIDERFFKPGQEAKKTTKWIERILHNYTALRDPNETAKEVIEFLEEIWNHFSIGKYAKIFVDFARAEKALYGLGESYRDHLIHVFNVFFTGLLAFSKALRQDERIFKLLKIQEESKNFPFPNRYDKWRRLFYLWCLVSTFHDIAIPIDHMKEIDDGLSRLLSYFKMQPGRLSLEFPFMIQFDVSRYTDLSAKIFARGIVMNQSEEEPAYKLPKTPTGSSLYFRSVLSDAIGEFDHGVLGAYFLFKSIEEMFLTGKNPNFKYDPDLSALVYDGRTITLPPDRQEWDVTLKKLGLDEEKLNNLPRIYDLSRGETKKYNDYVFEQDVTRAALAIALHNLNPSRYPKIFPIRFSKLPLSFLLILFDELQEFYRPESFLLTEIVRSHKLPLIEVGIKHLTKNKRRIQITIDYNLEKLTGVNGMQVVSKYNEWAKKRDRKKANTYGDVVRSTWTNTFEVIRSKLSFEKTEPLEIQVRVKVDSKDPNGRPLKFRSPNWTELPETNIKV